MAHNFESISTSIVRTVRIVPLKKIEGVSTLRKAWQSLAQPLSGQPTHALAQWERELLNATSGYQRPEDQPLSEQEAGAKAPLKTFVEMERWLTANGYAIVKVEDQ